MEKLFSEWARERIALLPAIAALELEIRPQMEKAAKLLDFYA